MGSIACITVANDVLSSHILLRIFFALQQTHLFEPFFCFIECAIECSCVHASCTYTSGWVLGNSSVDYVPWLCNRSRSVVPKIPDLGRAVSCKFTENVVKDKCFLIEILKYSALLVWSNGNLSAFITLNSRTEQIWGSGSLAQQFWISNPEVEKKQYSMTLMIHDL